MEQGRDATQRQPQVRESMDNLEGVCLQTEEVVNRLESRLESVLRKSPPVCDGDKEKKEKERVPLAFAINELLIRFKISEMRIDDIINRIEV